MIIDISDDILYSGQQFCHPRFFYKVSAGSDISGQSLISLLGKLTTEPLYIQCCDISKV